MYSGTTEFIKTCKGGERKKKEKGEEVVDKDRIIPHLQKVYKVRAEMHSHQTCSKGNKGKHTASRR